MQRNSEDAHEKDGEEHEEEEEEEEEEEAPEEEVVVDPKDVLTPDQFVYYRGVFDSIDVDKKERIPAKTIGFVLRMMGLNPTKAEIRKIIMKIDPGNTGIDFKTFLIPIAERINQEPESHEEIIAAFRIFDEEENEYLQTDQMIEYLTTLGEDLEDFEIEPLLKVADPKGTGKVQYVDFVEKMMGIVRKKPKKGKGKGDKGKKGKKKK